jgi:4-aminobutyrate aminotransferase-like enzyme
MLPPLTISAAQIKQAVHIIEKACAEWQAQIINQEKNPS